MVPIKYKHQGLVEEACEFILSKAFAKEELPKSLEYNIAIEPQCYSYVLRCYIRFETNELQCYLTFNLDPERVGLTPNPDVPGLYNIFLHKAVKEEDSPGYVRYEWENNSCKWALALKP